MAVLIIGIHIRATEHLLRIHHLLSAKNNWIWACDDARDHHSLGALAILGPVDE